MPLVDLPLNELRTYAGRNPRPADFDEYWTRALDELHAVEPQVELRPVESPVPYADCFEYWFTGVGGARVFAKHLRPKNLETPAPAVIEFHGYAWKSSDWIDLCKWPSIGFSVWAMDVRGQGGRSQDTGVAWGNTQRGHIIRGLDDEPDRLLFRSIFLDCAQLAGLTMSAPGVDPARVGCTGASQGGALSLVCAALEPRIKRCVSVYPFLCDYQRVWEMDLAKDAFEELRYYFRMFDPQHKREPEVFEKLGYIDVQHLAPRIRGEVKMFTGLMDTICPPSTQFAAYNKITAPKSVEIYPDFGHEGLIGSGDLMFRFLSGL